MSTAARVVVAEDAGSGFSFRRVGGIMLRQAYLYKRTLHRWLEILYWPTVDVLLWGFLTLYLQRNTTDISSVAPRILGALILWDVMFRAQQSVAVGFLEDMWGRNVLNIWASPIRASEYITGTILIGILRVAIGASVAITLGVVLYNFNFFSLGLVLVPFVLALAIMGWAVGVVTTAVVLRLGQGAEELAWAIAFLFQPFSCVFYPLAVLPGWMQAIAKCIPASYIFEGMRQILAEGPFPTKLLVQAYLVDAIYVVAAWAIFAWMLKAVRERGLLSRFGE
jgi:ABC-2 type transport system permease protein